MFKVFISGGGNRWQKRSIPIEIGSFGGRFVVLKGLAYCLNLIFFLRSIGGCLGKKEGGTLARRGG